MTRSEIQEKIDSLRGGQTIKLADLTPSIASWLDLTDLSQDTLTHAFIRDHILDDLNSYEGVTS